MERNNRWIFLFHRSHRPLVSFIQKSISIANFQADINFNIYTIVYCLLSKKCFSHFRQIVQRSHRTAYSALAKPNRIDHFESHNRQLSSPHILSKTHYVGAVAASPRVFLPIFSALPYLMFDIDLLNS